MTAGITSSPEFPGRQGAGPLAPGLPKDAVNQQHGHVAAHPVALAGQREQGSAEGLAEAGCKGVDLNDVRPGWKIGVPAMGQQVVSHLQKRLRGTDKILWSALDEIVRVFLNPRVVRGHVVGHQVQD